MFNRGLDAILLYMGLIIFLLASLIVMFIFPAIEPSIEPLDIALKLPATERNPTVLPVVSHLERVSQWNVLVKLEGKT